MARRAALAVALFAVVFAVAFAIGRAGDDPAPSGGSSAQAGKTPVAADAPTPVSVSGLDRVNSTIPALRTPTPEATPRPTRTPNATAPATATATSRPPTPEPTPTSTVIEG